MEKAQKVIEAVYSKGVFKPLVKVRRFCPDCRGNWYPFVG